MNRNPIVRRLGKIFLPLIIISLAKKQSENQPHFSNRSEYVLSYGYREQPTKTEQRLYGELVRPTEASQVLTTPVVEQQRPQTSDAGYLRALALIENKALLLQQNQTVLFDVIS